jgi:hypothetical protein
MALNSSRNSSKEIFPSQTRKIKPTRRSVSGVFAFRKQESIPFESTLERDFLIRTEFSTSVMKIVPQPVCLPFVGANGRTYTYTPDFLVYYYLGDRIYEHYPKPRLIEVKPESEWRKHWREWLPKWKAARRYAQEQGWVFHIRDESRIRDEAFENICFLERYKTMEFCNVETKEVLETVEAMSLVTLDLLLARHFMGNFRAEGVCHLWHLLATRQLDCDISRPLNAFTEVWIPHAV